MSSQQLLQRIFNHDFTKLKKLHDFHQAFFDEALDVDTMQQVFALVSESRVSLGGREVPAAIRIPGKNTGEAPFMILAMLHGNEPAGLAGILLAMALSSAGQLERDVIGVIGNPLAARQYFASWAENPGARQESRDAFRCGLSENGALLPDMNRIPVDFLTLAEPSAHVLRARELYHLGQHVTGVLDIHSARGNMVCVTDYKHESDLKQVSIRTVLTELADAISAHASGAAVVQTLKTILAPLPNIHVQVGIEAGRHEAPETPYNAASFTLSLLHGQGLTATPPLEPTEGNRFTRFRVQPRLTYGDLLCDEELWDNDKLVMAKRCKSVEQIPERSDRVIVEKKDGSFTTQTVLEHIISPLGTLHYCIYQYEEMEAIKREQVVAVALPSGIELRAPRDFSGIFFSKSASLYDKDPAVGPWPVAAGEAKLVKFCYPCEVGEVSL